MIVFVRMSDTGRNIIYEYVARENKESGCGQILMMSLCVYMLGSSSVYCLTLGTPWHCDIMYANASTRNHGLTSNRARRLWMEIACTGQAPVKSQPSLHSKHLSSNSRERRCVRVLDQVLQSKGTNGMKHSCANGRSRVRLRKKSADRFMYATDAIKHIRATATMGVHAK